jgi:hypothetical protein
MFASAAFFCDVTNNILFDIFALLVNQQYQMRESLPFLSSVKAYLFRKTNLDHNQAKRAADVLYIDCLRLSTFA